MEECQYIFWDPTLLDWSRKSDLWIFGPEFVDEILNEVYMIEFSQSVLNILSKFCYSRYRFCGAKELRSAVDMWHLNKKNCFEEFNHISLWDVSRIQSMSCLFTNMWILTMILATGIRHL